MKQGTKMMIGIGAVCFLMLAGCSTLPSKSSSLSTTTPGVTKTSSSGYYTEFGDVYIPKALKKDTASSFVYETPGASAGVVSLKGRVEINSLIDAFNSRMADNGWELVSSIKAQRSIMMYHKENRWCVISVNDKNFSTYVDIWVAPTVNDICEFSQEGLTK